MTFFKVFVLVLTLNICNVLGATKPGFKARITLAALEYANQEAIDILAKQAASAKIPDQSGSADPFDYSLSNIQIRGVNKPNSQITIAPGTGLTWSGTNAGVQLYADWRVKTGGFIPISFSGSVDASVSGVNFETTMSFGADANGRPSIASGSCSCSVSSVSIDIHGDLSFLLNLFKSLIEDKIRDAIPGMACSGVKKAIDTSAEKKLQNLPVTALLLDKKFQLDYRLVSAPSFQTPYMETFHQGEITWAANSQTPPFSPDSLPPYSDTSRMLYLWVGSYVPESFLYAAQTHGFLQYNLTASDLPPEDRGFLNTTCTSPQCIGNLIPVIGQKYPNSTVELRMNSTTLANASIAPGQLGASFAGDIACYAHTPQGQTVYLLTLNVSAIFNLTATISNQLIKGNISGASFQVGVLDSAVGPLNPKVINTVVGVALKLFIIPVMNEKGNAGFPLPVTGDITFANTQLVILQDAVMVATDLKYNRHFKL